MESHDATKEDTIKQTHLSETKRVSRNMNEKRRRDRFNVLISELAAVIPESSASGKIDKTTILKRAIAFLRNHQDVSSSSVVLSRPTANWQPAFVSDSELNQLLLETMNSFLLLLDGSGIITFASDSILSILGYRPQDVVNNYVADYLDQTDQSCIFAHLALMLEKVKTLGQHNSNPSTLSSPVSDVVKFNMIMNSGPCLDKQRVEVFSCSAQTFVNYYPHERPRHSTDSVKVQLMIVCRLTGPRANQMLPMSNLPPKEFTSRLTLSWKFTSTDPSVVDIVGFQPQELSNKSIYNFIHKDDLANVASYHKMLVSKGFVTTCYYRFLTKGETWIWLRSCCYISYNQWNSKPEYVTLTTRPINYEEVYANQELVLQSDKLQFQNISKDVNSLKATSVESTGQGSDSSASHPPSQASKDSKKSVAEVSSLWELSAFPKDSKDTEQNSNPSESASTSLSMFSSYEAPEGLTPAQYKLHKQLQGKHILLENSIKRQITELQKIKRQIEINKQLWEFNQQLQEKKAEKLSQTGASSKSCDTNDKCSDIASSYAPQDSNPEVIVNGLSHYSIDLPDNIYLPSPYIDPVVEQSSNSSTPSEPTQCFPPLQPYPYYQY